MITTELAVEIRPEKIQARPGFIPHLTPTELNEVAAQGQCSLTSAVGDFHMFATRNGKCQGNTTLIR